MGGRGQKCQFSAMTNSYHIAYLKVARKVDLESSHIKKKNAITIGGDGC